MPNVSNGNHRRGRRGTGSIGRACWLLALLLVTDRLPTEGFLIQTFDGPHGPVHQHWKDPQRVPFVLHSGGSADLTPELTHRLLRESFLIWESVPTATVGFIDQGLSATLTPSSQDRRNLVYFDETGVHLQAPRGSGIIAITRLSANERTGEIVDADIIFNGRDFRFATQDGSLLGRIDLKEVAIHEIGHLLGLEHTPLEGPVNTRPVMNPFHWGERADQDYHLKPDDIAGISSLYPAPGYIASIATISGQVADLKAAPVFGAHLVAEEVDRGVRISTLSGAYPQTGDRGRYWLRGLPPGRYRLSLNPVEGTITEDNFSGIFTQFVTGFATEYYDNVADRELAHIFSLAAGQHLKDIDIITGLTPPGFPQLQAIFGPNDTPDPQGPYTVLLQAADIAELWLRYRLVENASPVRLSMAPAGPGLFAAPIPGQPVGTRISYQIEARSPAGNTAFFPSQGEWLTFSVMQISGAPLIFTALRDDNSISVIDTRQRRELTRLRVGAEPIQLLLDPDTGRLFVTHLSSNELFVIDASTFQIIERLATPLQPLDMSLSPDRRTLYATNSGAASLTLLDIASATTRTLPLPIAAPGPYGIAVTSTRIYVTDINTDRVLVLTLDGTLVEWLSVPGQPRSLALSPDRKILYLTSLNSNLLTLIDTQEQRIVETIPLPVNGTFAVASNPDGRKIYLTAPIEGALIVVDAETTAVLGTLATGDDPRGLGFSPDGTQLFVTSAFANQITIVDALADSIIETFATGPNPRGIALHQPARQSVDNGDQQTDPPPAKFDLAPNYPNPFNLFTRITYTLPPGESPIIPVQLQICNVLGQPIRTLTNQSQAPGTYTLEWDGRDDRGNRLTSGVYLVMLRAGRQQTMQKAVLLR